MKKIILNIAILLLAAGMPASVFAQPGPPWVKYNVGYNYILRGIDFPDNQDDIGYIAGESLTYSGDGLVLKTTDGGTTWTPVLTGPDIGFEGSCFVALSPDGPISAEGGAVLERPPTAAPPGPQPL
jgi:hypothetical protein